MSRHLELQKKYNELNARNKKEGRKKFSKDLGKPKVKITKGTTSTSTKVVRNKKLDVVIVSVNYNDYLSVTLSHNSKIFDNITVVTSLQDILCKKICEKFGAKYVVTDIMYDDNAKFNKGKAINEGLRSIENPDFILLIDADIIVSNKIDLNSIDEDYLYTSDRYICKSYNLLQSYINDGKKIEDIFKYESDKGMGFFQLFNINHNSIDRNKVYPETSTDASWDDLIFRDKFPKRGTLSNTIIHLGDPYQNWTGRVTNRFLSDEELYKILTKKSTFTICSYLFKYNKDERQKNNFKKFLSQFEKYYKKMVIGISSDCEIDFEIPCEVIKVKNTENIWSKELIINKIVESIETDYILWIDGDIIFDNLDWLNNIDDVVSNNDFVQLFDTINYLGENGEILETHKSITSAKSNDIDDLLKKGYKPGGAWLGQTKILKEKKLFDQMIVGGGDTIFTYGLYKTQNGQTLKEVQKYNSEIYKEANQWINNFGDYKVGYLNETVNHLYHGDLKDRNYNGRYKKLYKPKLPFTIFITAYKTSDFIEECLDSISNQTYFFENDVYEILLGIDCCTETLDKVKEIREKYKNLRIFYFTKNMGTYVTSNTLINLAKYENLIRFDSDDIMNDHFVESVSEYAKNYKIIRFNCKNFTKQNYEGRTNLSYGCIFFKKELFNCVGGYKDWTCSADKDFVQRCQSISEVKNIDKILFKRRIHSNSLTRHKDTNSESEKRKIYNNMISEKFEYVNAVTNKEFVTLESKRIVFIYDVEGWAFHKMSISIKRHLTQYNVDIKKYDDFIDSGEYDVIICFSPNVLPKYARDYKKIACGISSYKSEVNNRLSKFKFVFSNDKKLYDSLNNKNKFYLPNGIECDRFNKVEKQIYIDDIKIGTIGSYKRREHKGILRISKITEMLNSQGYKITDKSLFVDPYGESVLNHEQLLDYYKENIDVLIISSESETGPNILLEAMSLGIPVIANKTGLCGELIKDGENGFLVDDFDDLDSYIEKLKILCDNPEIYNKISKSSNESVKMFDWSILYKNYSDMIKFILNDVN
jgi:glycosyltransferase involved in cell wall biosynthesis